MIRRDLREEIRAKQDKLSHNPGYYDEKVRQIRDALSNEGDVYSFWIEHPELRKSLLLDGKQPETVKRMAAKGIRQIKNAWYFLSEHGRNMDFHLVLNPVVLTGTNALVVGRRAVEGTFRTRDVSLGFPDYTPPSYGKVPQLVDSAIQGFTDVHREDPLEAAIYLHLNLALIQPFMEGNKRTARLVQDRVLFDAGLPPAIIPAGEGKFYFSLLERSSRVPNRTIFSEQEDKRAPFYNYVASKVNNGLDAILGDLNIDEH